MNIEYKDTMNDKAIGITEADRTANRAFLAEGVKGVGCLFAGTAEEAFKQLDTEGTEGLAMMAQRCCPDEHIGTVELYANGAINAYLRRNGIDYAVGMFRYRKPVTPKVNDKPISMKQLKELIHADSYSFKDGVYTLRWGFFYRMGKTTQTYIEKVKATLPYIDINSSGEVWKAFRGGASIANSSHWYVQFRVTDADLMQEYLKKMLGGVK